MIVSLQTDRKHTHEKVLDEIPIRLFLEALQRQRSTGRMAYHNSPVVYLLSLDTQRPTHDNEATHTLVVGDGHVPINKLKRCWEQNRLWQARWMASWYWT